MSSDIKTLADAQPGGRVRLADQALSTTELRRNAHVLVLQELRARFTDAGSPSRTAALDAAIAALSAQPSPGGQGGLNYERMFVDACAELAEVSRELGCDPEQGGSEPILAAIAELRDALAARQPVGIDSESALRKARLALADQCEWGSEKRACLSGELDSSPAMKALISVCAAPPAQAVDLEKLRLLGERIEQVGKNAAPTAMGSGNVYFRNVIDWGRELLALIDSQAEVSRG
ncbi:TPA: hypothetical protein QEL43_003183 [Stenotrophomonas maltophilia]|nr:hypothetical protein [Stenotrophomonas maltophilia]